MLSFNLPNFAIQPLTGDLLQLWTTGLSVAGKPLAFLAILGLFAFGRLRFVSEKWADRCRRWIKVLVPLAFRIEFGAVITGALLSAAALVSDLFPANWGPCLLGWGILFSGGTLIWQNILWAWPTGPQSALNAPPVQVKSSRPTDELARSRPRTDAEVRPRPWQLCSAPGLAEIGLTSFVGVAMLVAVYSLSFLWTGASLPFISGSLHRVWNPGQIQRILADPLPIGGSGAGNVQPRLIDAGNAVHMNIVVPHLPKWIRLASLLPPEGQAGNVYRKAIRSGNVILIPSGLFWAASSTQLGYMSLAIGLIGWLGTWTMRLIFTSFPAASISTAGPGEIARIRPVGLSGLPLGLACAISSALLATFCGGLCFLLLPLWADYQMMQNGLLHAAIIVGWTAIVPVGYAGLLLQADAFRAGMVSRVGSRKGDIPSDNVSAGSQSGRRARGRGGQSTDN